ncbi:His-Xaa-Ser system radical SAM maturase HxsB, partial [Vibrio parahaemolyticus]|nr:His-Xaa-Ser system radical SAM maturase HxsB [Vibrio parahaemolyticus]
MNVLPFNFEFLDSDIALLTNQAGFHAYLSRMELNSLIDKNSTDDAVIDELLERKLFICDDEYKSASVGSLASGLSKR